MLDILYLVGYNNDMMTIKETEFFKNWMRNLKDRMARSVINARIRRLSLGNKGDSKYIGNGISELRVDYGPGYRVYFIQTNQDAIEIIILLCGGDKSSQANGIEKAKQIALNLEDAE